jgi:mannosyltransferase
LHLWMQLAGDGEAATRSLSLVFAVLAVPVAWWAAAAIAGRRAGVLAAAAVAGCPFLVYLAHETRMYSLVVVLSLVASAAFVLAFVEGRRAHLMTLGASLVLLLYTHTWALFLVAGMAAAWMTLWRARRVSGRDAALLAVVVALLYAPWAPSLIFQTLHTAAPWSERPSPLFLVALAPPIVAIARLRHERDRPIRLLVVIATCGAALAWIGSQVEPAWSARYLAVLSGPLLLAATCGLARRKPWAAAPPVVLAAIWLLAGLPAGKSNARAVAASVAISVRPGDLVISTQPEQVPVLYRYLPADVRYITPIGIPNKPQVMDWRDALPRLRAGRAGRVLIPRLRNLPAGRRVVLVTPVPRRPPSHAPWSRAVRARTHEWRAAVRGNPRLRALGRTSRPDPGRFRSTVQAELFEVEPHAATSRDRWSA